MPEVDFTKMEKVPFRDDVKKSMKKSLSGLAPEQTEEDFEKQNLKGILTDKRITMEPADNDGVIMRISMDVEFGKGEQRRFRYITKNLVFSSMKEAIPTLEKEMKFNVGDEITMGNVKKDKTAKVTVRKRDNLSFTFGQADGDGHLHVATGKIVDKKVDKVIKKFFIGESKENGVLWPYGTFSNKAKNGFTKEVESFFKSHSHKFEVELTREDESGWRVMGQSNEVDGHSHPIDIIDFWSVETTNTPDK
jgi:hypothetical protein